MANTRERLGRKDLTYVPIDKIDIDPDWNEREEMEGIEELCVQIIENRGVLQPITVRRSKGNRFTLINGERRVTAQRMAIQLKSGMPETPEFLLTIPAMVKSKSLVEYPDDTALMDQLLSNEGMKFKPMERARIYRRLRVDYGWSEGKIAKHTGTTQGHVAQQLRLLDATPAVENAMQEGLIPPTTAGAIIRNADKTNNPGEAQEKAVEAIRKSKETEQDLRIKIVKKYSPMLLEEVDTLRDHGVTAEQYDGVRQALLEEFTKEQMLAYNLGRVSKLCELITPKGDLHDLPKIMSVINN